MFLEMCSVLTVGEVKRRWKSVGVDCRVQCGISGTCMCMEDTLDTACGG